MIEKFFELTVIEGVIFSVASSAMMLFALILIKANTKRGYYQPKDKLHNNPPR